MNDELDDAKKNQAPSDNSPEDQSAPSDTPTDIEQIDDTDFSGPVISPERLDSLMTVTSPRAWMAIIGCIILAVLGVVWLFFGEIPTKVQGTGMLINTAGLRNLIPEVSGKITKMDFQIGDLVAKGQVIATLEEIEIKREIDSKRIKLAEQKQAAKEKNILRDKKVESLKTKIENLEKKIISQTFLLEDGLILEQNLLDTKEQITSAENELQSIRLERLTDQYEINSLERELALLEEDYAKETNIISPYSGKIIEIKEIVGAILSAGSPLMTIELSDPDENLLEAIIYVPAVDGKQIKPGMSLTVSPSNIKPEQYGSLIAEVTFVSGYPASTKSMKRIFQNDELVSIISEKTKGSAVEVQTKLFRDPNTFSGYKWTTKSGAPFLLQSGTFCEAQITTKRRRPLELVAPQLFQVFNWGENG